MESQTIGSASQANNTRDITRVPLYDIVRGISVVSMVLFHLSYDLTELNGVSLPWFSGMTQDVWRNSISWTFLFVSGSMCAYSRNNLKRGLKLLALALAIYVTTLLAQIDMPISFGIIFCLGACCVLTAALEHVGLKPRGAVTTTLLLVVFAATLYVPRGWLGLPPITVALPSLPYETGLLSWLGFPGPTFISGDYYPMIPFASMYLAGSSMGRTLKEHGIPRFMTSPHCVPLEFIGRHALAIYVIHQPLLLGLTALLG